MTEDVAPPLEALHAAQIRAIAAAQDRAAFAALFAHFAPRLKSYLRRLGSDAGQAEEMAQETMLAVWRRAGQFDPARAGAAAWIFAIARNLRIDALRRARIIVPPPDPTDAEPPVPLADSVLEQQARAARLRAAIAMLPPEQAQLLDYAFFQERSHSEIEAALGIPLGTIKSRLRLAVARLRRVLGDLT